MYNVSCCFISIMNRTRRDCLHNQTPALAKVQHYFKQAAKPVGSHQFVESAVSVL